METPKLSQLYRQLFEQLEQWIVPKDRRHLQNCAEIVATILQAKSACLTRNSKFRSILRHSCDRLDCQKSQNPLDVELSAPSNFEAGIADSLKMPIAQTTKPMIRW